MIELKRLTAFIPAAGYGRRMGERCINFQKCMLPIWETKKPILFHIVNNMKQVGITNFVIAVNHCKDQIKDFFGDGKQFGINIKYVEGDFHSTYDTLMQAIEFLPNIFIYSHGDMIFRPEVYNLLVERFNINGSSTIALMPNTKLNMTHPQLTVKNNTVTNIFFNADIGQYPYMYLGGAIYNKTDFEKNFNGDYSGMVEKVLISKLNKKEIINAIIYNKEWRHLMNEEDYQLVANEKNWLNLE